MVTKVWDAGEFYVEYDIRPTARKYTFTDTSGREVTMTELGFFDPWFVTEMGFQDKHEILTWWNANRNNSVFNRSTDKFNDSLYYFFDTHPFAGDPYVGLLNRPDEPISFVKNDQSSTPYQRFLLVLPDEGEDQEQDKPTFKISSLGWGGKAWIEPVVQHSPDVRTSEINSDWTRKLNYSFKMDPTEFNFFRKVNKESDDIPMYGMELELSTQLSSEEIQYIVTEIEPKQEPFFIFKDDSSISGRYNNRYELVTVPCSRKYLRVAWKTFFEKLNKLCKAQGKSLSDFFDTSDNLSNGIHVHVSKDKFLGEFHKSKFLAAWNQWDSTNVSFLTKISGRPMERFNQNYYCPIDSNFEGRTLARRLKRRVGTSQRSVCHTQNSATLEVRLYQGIVDIKHILRCLDHVDAMFEFTNQMGMKTFGRDFVNKFEEFVLKGNKYRSLRNFIMNGEAA